jgi:hypothetical protein
LGREAQAVKTIAESRTSAVVAERERGIIAASLGRFWVESDALHFDERAGMRNGYEVSRLSERPCGATTSPGVRWTFSCAQRHADIKGCVI